jgi:Rrf2 family protein
MAANSRFALATHIMTSLAAHAGANNMRGSPQEESLSSSYLGSSANTNPVVIRRILGDLQKAGLVQTCPGKSGGASLAKKPQQINLLDIYLAVDDGHLFAFNPNSPNKECPLSCAMKSVLAPVFQSAEGALHKDLKKIKLSELVEQLVKSIPNRNVQMKES